MSSKDNTAPSSDFRTDEVTVRGTTYKFRELSANEYDAILKVATGPDDNADLGAVLKMMAIKSLVEPSLTAAELGDKPYPVYSKILQAVNKLHFGNDEADSPNA